MQGRGHFPQRLAGVLAVTLVWVFVAQATMADTIIYSREDENGVVCFTNVPTTRGFETYMVFRDIMSRAADPAQRAEIIEIAKHYSRVYGMDERLIQAVIEVESGYDVNAVSSAGAEGLMQIMPGTQRDLGVTNSFDPDENIEAGVRYLQTMIDRFGTVELGLAAYNAGPSNVERYGGIPPFDETQQYVRKVLSRYQSM
ncbi:MAG: lytic transglycosylase domain-containing protein [Desulfovibrio sp.]|nr:MAG: lytic transglycosylase domain-containing protein [Desulfovibrio sp.]